MLYFGWMGERQNSVKTLERKAETIRQKQTAARATERDLRRAKGPWAATNRKANKRLQAKLALQLAEVSRQIFKAKMREEGLR